MINCDVIRFSQKRLIFPLKLISDEHKTTGKAIGEKKEVIMVTKTATTCDNGEPSHNMESINDNKCLTPSSPQNGTINEQENSIEGSVCNLNVISSINLESDFIEAVIDEYKHKSTEALQSS